MDQEALSDEECSGLGLGFRFGLETGPEFGTDFGTEFGPEFGPVSVPIVLYSIVCDLGDLFKLGVVREWCGCLFASRV